MYGLKKRINVTPVGNDLKEKAKWHISTKIDKIKNYVASRLSDFEQQLTIIQKKICLFVFCISMCSISAGLIFQGFSSSDKKPTFLLQKGSIKTPLNTTLPDSLDIKWLKEIQRMKQATKVLKDSIIK